MSHPLATIRIYQALRDGAALSAYALAERCFCTPRHAQHTLVLLREVGLAHIARYRRQHGDGARGRPPLAIWVYGPGADAAKPTREPATAVRRRRLKRLTKKYGSELANRILRSRKEGGSSVLMLEGELAYRRGKPRGRRFMGQRDSES